MDHRLIGPVGLKDEIGFFPCQVAFYNAFLIHARDAVVTTKRRGKVSEDVWGGSCKPIETLLGLEVPVKEVAGVSLRSVTIFRDSNITPTFPVIKATFIGSVASGNLAQHGFGIFGVTPCLTVRPPFDMDESLEAGSLCQEALLVFAIIATVPAGPDRRRIYIRNISREVTASKSSRPGVVEPVCQITHPGHKIPDSLLIDAGIFIRPVVLIAESPDNDGGMVIVLVDHMSEHVLRVLLKCFVPDASPTQGNFFPNHETKLIAQLKH